MREDGGLRRAHGSLHKQEIVHQDQVSERRGHGPVGGLAGFKGYSKHEVCGEYSFSRLDLQHTPRRSTKKRMWFKCVIFPFLFSVKQ